MPLDACKMDIARNSLGNGHSDGVADECNIADPAGADAYKVNIVKLHAGSA